MSLLFPFALQNAVLFESIIALCRASVVMSLGRNPNEDKDFIRHRGRTVQQVTSALTTEEAVNDANLLAVAMLLTLEYLTGNVRAVAAHLSGLERMTSMRQDLEEGTPWNQFGKAGLQA